jgi:hypothetical protein
MEENKHLMKKMTLETAKKIFSEQDIERMQQIGMIEG